ncbi:MAG: hypothetical protein GTN36_05515 [Candidatus Aenigmarchaeota archaeon]|nr:hypothetical protein [Candidatus Aenigmarchaeota archaeon]
MAFEDFFKGLELLDKGIKQRNIDQATSQALQQAEELRTRFLEVEDNKLAEHKKFRQGMNDISSRLIARFAGLGATQSQIGAAFKAFNVPEPTTIEQAELQALSPEEALKRRSERETSKRLAERSDFVFKERVKGSEERKSKILGTELSEAKESSLIKLRNVLSRETDKIKDERQFENNMIMKAFDIKSKKDLASFTKELDEQIDIRKSDKTFLQQKELIDLKNEADINLLREKAKFKPANELAKDLNTRFKRDPNVSHNKENDNKFREISAKALEFKQLLSDMRDDINKHGTEFTGDAAARMSSRYDRIILVAKEYNNLGVLQKIDEELLQRTLPNPTTFGSNISEFTPFVDASNRMSLIYNDTIKDIDNKLNIESKNRGFIDTETNIKNKTTNRFRKASENTKNKKPIKKKKIQTNPNKKNTTLWEDLFKML